jgi:hypothetical protein
MITIGLAKELFFIAKVTNQPVSATLNGCLQITVQPNSVMDVEYNGVHIWNERVEGDGSFFGIESCDNIFKIIASIDSKDESWRDKFYYNESHN